MLDQRLYFKAFSSSGPAISKHGLLGYLTLRSVAGQNHNIELHSYSLCNNRASIRQPRCSLSVLFAN
jgi:hypothetical protein